MLDASSVLGSSRHVSSAKPAQLYAFSLTLSATPDIATVLKSALMTMLKMTGEDGSPCLVPRVRLILAVSMPSIPLTVK